MFFLLSHCHYGEAYLQTPRGLPTVGMVHLLHASLRFGSAVIIPQSYHSTEDIVNL